MTKTQVINCNDMFLLYFLRYKSRRNYRHYSIWVAGY